MTLGTFRLHWAHLNVYSTTPSVCLRLPRRDLWRITTFLREKGFDADVAGCRQRFPDMLTFDQFLAATRWGDASRTYEQGIVFDGPLPPPSSSKPAASRGQAVAAKQ